MCATNEDRAGAPRRLAVSQLSLERPRVAEKKPCPLWVGPCAAAPFSPFLVSVRRTPSPAELAKGNLLLIYISQWGPSGWMEQPGTAKNERLRVYDVVVVGRGGRISQREKEKENRLEPSSWGSDLMETSTHHVYNWLCCCSCTNLNARKVKQRRGTNHVLSCPDIAHVEIIHYRVST